MQAEFGVGGFVGLSKTTPGTDNLVKLIRQGGKLGVLGCEEADPRWWHVLRPGTWSTPDLQTGMTHGRALCGRIVISNGYAADWRPPEGSLCPACNERL